MMADNVSILALETATSACSIALKIGDELICRYEEGSNIHSHRLLEMIEEGLNEAGANVNELDMIAVGQGPGSFTGLRIGVGVAQGIAFASNCPMVGVSSLHSLALRAADTLIKGDQITQTVDIIVGIDARMGEVYWAEFIADQTGVRLKDRITVSRPDLISSKAQAPILVGNGWSEYATAVNPELLQRGQYLDFIQLPRAREILLLAEGRFKREGGVSAAEFEADYVRNNVAKKSSKR